MENSKIREKIGDYFLDLSKVVFGGAVLATVTNLGVGNQLIVLIFGIFATLMFALVSVVILMD